MRKTMLQADAGGIAGHGGGTGFTPRQHLRTNEPLATAEDAEVAAYLLDLMIAARRMAVARQFSFLAYLVGMAAEEARLLGLGRSASPRGREAPPATAD